MTTSASRIQECLPGEGTQVGKLLARAFEADPMLSYLTARAKDARLAREIYFRFCFQSTQIRSTSADGRAAALWVVPDARVGFRDQLRLVPSIVWQLGMGRVPECLRIIQAMDRAHPRETHYYLMAVGVVPEAQGEGLGTMLIKHTLAQADRRKIPAYLDTSNPRNLPLYQRLGFRILEEIKATPKAPPFWTLLRNTP